MSKILELKNKDKTGKERICGKFEIKNQTEEFAELFIYGDIMNYKWEDSDVTPQDVADFLKEIDGKNKLNIYINSGGGSVFAGLAIYNQLKRHKAEKTVYVDGVAASIASVIALSGDKVIIPSNAFMMIHKPWSWTWGNANDMRKMADDLDRIEEGILNVYKENLREGVDIEKIKEMVAAETWLTGEEAAKYFDVEVSEENKAVACMSDYFDTYKKVPQALKTQLPPEQPPTNFKNSSGAPIPIEPPKDNLEKEKLLLELDLL